MPGQSPERITAAGGAGAGEAALTPGTPTAWSPADLADPHAAIDKPERVRRMFGAIARAYDLNNRVHSLGRDQAWRRAAVRAAGVRPGDVTLDIACGTGDLTALLARSPASRVIGLDFTPEMLAIAARKRERLPGPVRAKIEYLEGDALALPLPDASVDVATIAFGLRNVADPARALAEFARVLRPGGRLVILEFERPRRAPARWVHDLYCGWIMPRTATLLSGDTSGAYRYLPRSVSTFATRERLADLLLAAGFERPTSRALTLGICVCTRAHRAASSPPPGPRSTPTAG